MRSLSRAWPLVLLLTLFAAGASRASAVVPQEAAAQSASQTISFPVNGLQYSPTDVTIFVGEDVEWKGPFTFHPLVSNENLWPVVYTSDSFRFIFTQPGTYRYYCQVHGGPGGLGMSGIVRVVAATRTYLPVVFR